MDSNSDPSFCMDSFNEDLLLPREWLVKADPKTSAPYLIKFHSSTVDLTCCIMITDTKQTWVEALSSKQFARRWRQCNERVGSPFLEEEEEEAWRARSLDLLSRAHTLGGIPELSFEVVESKFGDLAFQMECNAFKWRWETVFVGHKISADILSKHLIMPMITANHLAFSSPDVVGDLSSPDLDKAIDKLARTARRAVDTHVKNALSKPRLATTIRRITAVFNFISDPPNVSTDAVSQVLLPSEPITKMKRSSELFKTTRTPTLELNDRRNASTSSKGASLAPSRRSSPPPIKRADSGSATEPEDDSFVQPSRPIPSAGSCADQQPDMPMRSPTPSREKEREAPYNPGNSRGRSVTKASPSDTDSSPARPVKKKAKALASSSDEDSEGERRKVVGRTAFSGSGLRQPIKRGGKRF